MKSFLYTFGCYVGAVLVGGVTTLFVLPPLAQNIFSAHVPAMSPTFSEMYFFRAVLIFEAASVTAITGFFVRDIPSLRRTLFTLPIWAPLAYAILYLALSYR